MQVFRARHDREIQVFRARHDQEMQDSRENHNQEMQNLTSRVQQDLRVAAEQITRRSEFLAERREPIFAGVQTIGIAVETELDFAEGQIITLNFVAPEDGQYRIEATAVGDDFDPYLYLYNENRMLLAEDDDGAGDLNARIEEDLVQDATYYINVEELVGRAGICELMIQLLQ